MAGVSLGDIKEVGSLASSVFKLGETWYDDAPETLVELKSLVTNAEATYKSWQRRKRDFGLASDETLQWRLQTAKERFEREKARLEGLDRGFGRLRLCLSLSAGIQVPEQLKQSIVDLNQAISVDWRDDDDAEEAALKRAEKKARAPRFGFKRDWRYVRIPSIEDKLKGALNQGGTGYEAAQVVFLHGRAGCGKTSMGRHLALDYQEECRTFDQVLYLDCGLNADWKKKQAELLEMLPGRRTSNTEKVRGMIQKGKQDKDAMKNADLDKKLKGKADEGSNDAADEATGGIDGDQDEVESLLIQLLKDSITLIVFDDVWEWTFLNRMVGVCGRHMKVLVTTQKQGLSDFLTGPTEPLSISMDRIAPEDSLKILMVLTGFHEQDAIAEDVKKCMKQLVENVKGHPHAIASIASGIDKYHKEEVQQWQDVMNTYKEYLEESLDPDDPLYRLHGVSYERSVFGAIEVKFAQLVEGEKTLLILMTTLKGPPVHQEVIQFFHRVLAFPVEDEFSKASNATRSSRIFRTVRKRLEDLQWIKTHDHVDAISWSIHSLDEWFIQSRLADEIQETMVAIKNLPIKMLKELRDEVQPNAVRLLVASYFRDEIAQKMYARFHLLRGIPWWFEYMGVSERGIHLQVSMPENFRQVQSVVNEDDSVPLIVNEPVENMLSGRSTISRKTAFEILLSLMKIKVREYHNVIASGLRSFLKLDPNFRASRGEEHTVWTTSERHWDGDVEQPGQRSKSDGLFSDLPDQFWYQERGTVKRIMGDLPGALQDLDTSFQLDPKSYEVLKQRGYVKFLMGDEDGARADAEKAVGFKPKPSDGNRRLRKHVWYSDHEGSSWVIYVESGAMDVGSLEKVFQLELRNDTELLKQRAYVKFLMGNDTGARADANRAIGNAKRAIGNELLSSDKKAKQREHESYGTSIVEYLGFRL